MLGCLATSGAKSDVIFLLGDPDFLYRRRNFAPILLSYRAPHFGLFEFFGVWGYLATSGAKSDVMSYRQSALDLMFAAFRGGAGSAPLNTPLVDTCLALRLLGLMLRCVNRKVCSNVSEIS